MTGRAKPAKESRDLRLGDALVGLPCLQRQRAQLTAGLRDEKGGEAVECPVCGIEVPELRYQLHEAADRMVVDRVQQMFPGWQPEDGLCGACLERFGEVRAGARSAAAPADTPPRSVR